MTRPWMLAVAAGIVTFFLVAFFLLSLPVIPDTDSYFHLAAARLYAEQGFVKQLPWPRYSVMHETFGDKDLLFHIVLMPLVHGDTLTWGRIAVAAFNGLIAALLVLLGIDIAGRHGAWIAPLLYLTVPYFWSRSIRLRPELLSLVLLLALVLAARRQRVFLAAILACLYALSYVAVVHVIGAFAMLWVLFTRRWKTGVAIFSGLAVGLLVHPHFPDNIRIWWLQSVRYFFVKGTLDVGAEIGVPDLANLLLRNAGWFIAAIAMLVLLRPRRPDAYVAVPAAIFALLQLTIERMALYSFPFASFALMRPNEERRVNAKGLVAAAIVAVLASAPFTFASLVYMQTRVPPDLERDYVEFANRVPPGAKIAARWGATDAYVYFAPQGRYLNVLDPSFMALDHPREHAALRELFESKNADVATIAKTRLDSDYIAFPKFESSPEFLARLRAHPRVRIVYDGYNVLAKID